MRRAICLILVLLLALPVFAAAEQERRLVTIHCDNQGFSVGCVDDQAWEEIPGGGLILWVDQPKQDPYVMVFWDKTADKSDPGGYFTNVFTPVMEQTFGDKLMEPSDYRVYEVEGVSMPGVQYAYEGEDGRVYVTFRLLDLRWEGLVTYTLVYYYEEMDGEPMNVCCRAVKLFQPDAAVAGPTSNPASEPRELGDYRVSAAPGIAPKVTQYSCAEFTAMLPVGWKLETGGLFENYSIRCYDPSCPERCLFLMSQAGVMHKSQAGKQWWANYPGSFNIQKPLVDSAIVLPEPTISCFLKNMKAFRDSVEVMYSMHLSVQTLSPEVVPDIDQVNIWEVSSSDALDNYIDLLSQVTLYNTYPDASIVRFSSISSNNVACEGMAGGVVIDCQDPYYLNPTLDVWFYIPACFMGIMAPAGELQELEPTLTACLESFRFNDSYIRQAQQNSQVMAELIDLQSSWDARNRSYDVISQKYSDATLGYDRLYDSETGDVYRADLDFYDSYDLHRGEFDNANLYRIDDSTSDYYLESVDYYITR